MRRLLFASVLLLAACGDKQEISQSSGGDYSPNVVGDHAQVIQYVTNFYGADAQAVKRLQDELKLTKKQAEILLKQLAEKNTALNSRTSEFEALARKYADLEQRLGEYAKTDELAQQARHELDVGNLDRAETLLQQAYDKDYQLSRQRLAQRAFDLAEVAELKLDHDKALARYREVTQLQPDNVTAWWNLAKITQKLGNTTQALDAWRGMQQAAKTQQQERELAAAIMGEADILKANGDSKIAQEKYLQAHETLKKAAAAEPDNTQWQRDLSVSYEKLGNLYVANGDTPDALKAYQDSLAIRKKLVALDPKQTEWQRDLSVSYEKLGDLYEANGDTPAALKSYQDAHEIFKKLVALDPKQAQWQRDLSANYERIGDVYKANSDTPAALKSYQDALAIAQKLVALDPKQTNWQRDLSVSYNKLGDLYKANGDAPAALKAYQDSLAIRKKLVALDPQQVEWQTDIVASYFRLSTVESAKKKQYLQDALKILQTLNAANRLSKDKQEWMEIIEAELKGK